jgi:hypothetical protein
MKMRQRDLAMGLVVDGDKYLQAQRKLSTLKFKLVFLGFYVFGLTVVNFGKNAQAQLCGCFTF